jgi:predicted RNA-binding Zn ribbon-like protein
MTDPKHPTEPAAKLVGGELCLDFANTADWHAAAEPQEKLTSYEAVVSWAMRAEVLDADAARRLAREGAKRPAAANAALQQAIAVREAIYRIAVGIVGRQPPRPADLDTLNRALATALQHRRLVQGREGLAWAWQAGDRALDQVLGPVLWSAAGLFTSEKRVRIGQCADDRGCGWLFLDTSRNHSRRWCDMEDCGNRAKARRHYRRSRGRRRRPEGAAS